MSCLKLFGIIWLVLAGRQFVAAAPPDVRKEELPRIAPTPAEKANENFQVRSGFHVELMAAEPLIADPIAIAFDEDARAYVVEMRDYSERRDEKLGRVKLLHDDNGDGKYDRASIFADGLPWPTAVACWDGGVFVVATPELLYLKDTDGDERADVKAIVFTGFGNLMEKLNVQTLPNSMEWGPDQRLHLALGGNASKLSNFAHSDQAALELRGRDLSFDPRKLDLRAEPGGGQWGLTFDDLGRKYVCSNSRHIQQIIFPEYAPRTLSGLENSTLDIATDGPQAEVFRASAVEPWRILRTQWRVAGVVPGLIEGGGRASGYFTSACGITIYRGDAYPPEYHQNAFIADCGSNLIHRKVLAGEIVRTATRAGDETTSEFITSKDNWFRPVAFANAPDGCLWVCDMYREVVEHPASIPEPIKQHLDLNSGNDRGRLWRIAPDGFRNRPTQKLSDLRTSELVALLGHPNAWHRETAARLLHQRSTSESIRDLTQLLQTSPTAIGKSMALRVWAGVQATSEIPWQIALMDRDAHVRANALALIGSSFTVGECPPALITQLAKLSNDPSDEVRFRLSLLLPHWQKAERGAIVQALANGDVQSRHFRQVLIAAAGEATFNLWQSVMRDARPAQQQLALELITALGKRGQAQEINSILEGLVESSQRQRQMQALADGVRETGRSLAAIASAASLEKLTATAVNTLRDAKASPLDRASALQLLGWAGTTENVSQILATVHTDMTSQEVSAALQSLDRLNPPNLGQLYLSLWKQLPTGAHAELISYWRNRPAHVPELLAAITAGSIAKSDISATDVAALRGSSLLEIQRQVEQIFGAVSAREAAWKAFQPALTKAGSAIEGAKIFRAKCTTCHRKQGEGQLIGPDLDAAVTAGKEKLLTNILDPSREITAGYIAGIICTHDGEVISGIVAAETESGITLKIPGKEVRTFSRQEIELFKYTGKSLMPEGIETALSVQDIANLLEYLVTSQPVVQRRLPLLQFYTSSGEIAPITTVEQWQQRRADILASMESIMGPLPDENRRCELAPEILEETDQGSYIRRLITFASEPGSRVPAYLLIPKPQLKPKAAPVSAILCLHPTDNAIGHKVVVGLGGKANRQYAAELAERGFVTLSPAYPLLANYHPDLQQLGYASGTMKAIWDNRRALDYLESLEFVKPGKFGAIGHSLGGHNAAYTAAFDERIAAVVTSCGLDSYLDYKQGDITGWTSSRYMPRLAAYRGRVADIPFDFDEILASIAPRAVRIFAPSHDDNFQAESVDRLVSNATPIYQLLAVPTLLSVEHPDCGHDFPDAARRSAYDFLSIELAKQ